MINLRKYLIPKLWMLDRQIRILWIQKSALCDIFETFSNFFTIQCLIKSMKTNEQTFLTSTTRWWIWNCLRPPARPVFRFPPVWISVAWKIKKNKIYNVIIHIYYLKLVWNIPSFPIVTQAITMERRFFTVMFWPLGGRATGIELVEVLGEDRALPMLEPKKGEKD